MPILPLGPLISLGWQNRAPMTFWCCIRPPNLGELRCIQAHPRFVKTHPGAASSARAGGWGEGGWQLLGASMSCCKSCRCTVPSNLYNHFRKQHFLHITCEKDNDGKRFNKLASVTWLKPSSRAKCCPDSGAHARGTGKGEVCSRGCFISKARVSQHLT